MIAVKVDGNETIGMGHMMRCLAINETAKSNGIDTIFLVSSDTNTREIEASKTDYKRIYSLDVAEWLKNSAVKLLIVDSYSIEYRYLKEWNDIVPVLYIDDLNSFSYPVSAILNYNVEATKEMYSQCGRSNSILMIGPKYFPVRNEFAKVEKQDIRQIVKKVMITTGSTDSNEIIIYLLKELKATVHNDIEFLIMEGLFFNESYKKKIFELSNQYSNLRVLPWGQNMKSLYQKVDLVIAPGSTTIFEAFTVGTPCISFSFADNQIPQCNTMDAMEMCFYVGDLRDENTRKRVDIQGVFLKCLEYEERISQYKHYQRLFDGNGTQRIVKTMEKMYENNYWRSSISSTL